MPASDVSPTIPRFIQPPVRGSARVNVGATERVVTALGGAALAALGFARGTTSGAVLGAVGVALIARGASGYCPAFAAAGISTAESLDETPVAVEITETVTVTKSPEEAYAFWRALENLPRFMEHVERVHEMGDGRSLWTARMGKALPPVQWEAELLQDDPGRLLVWQSVEGADVDNAGHVAFKPAPHGGTEVRVRIAYRPPAGQLGHALARRLDAVFTSMVKADIRRFKNVIEASEVPTTEGQPQGR